MNKLLAITENISKYSVWFGGILLFAAAFLIAVEVLLRKLFSISMGGADELSSYVLAISCSWAFGFALFRKTHVRVDVLYVRLSKRLRYFLDILSLVLFLFYALTLVYYALIVLKTSIIRQSTANTPLQTPLWIPQSIWFFGLISFTVIIFLILVGTIYYLANEDALSAQTLSGASTLQKDIEEESGINVKSSASKEGEK